MKNINFNSLPEINDFQISSDSSGILLSKTNQLYHFVNDSSVIIQTPREIAISDFYFKDMKCGVIIGNSINSSTTSKSLITGSDNGWLLLLLFTLFFLCKKYQSKLHLRIRYSYVTLFFLLVIYSCKSNWFIYKSVDKERPFITQILSQPYIGPFQHKYFSNKEHFSYIAFTKNGGKDWLVKKLTTNFYAKSLVCIGNNYFVGTFANENTSDKNPYHGDGDIYIYGNDTSYAKILVNNTNYDKPFALDIQRGVNGFYCDSINDLIYIYGGETEPQFPENEVSTSMGNFSQLSYNLQSNYKIIDVPGISNVISFSKSKDGTIWVTMDNKIPEVFDGYIKFKELPNKALYKLTKDSNTWELVRINDLVFSFSQVEFVKDSEHGYLISDITGELFTTNNGGASWESMNILRVEKIKSNQNTIAILNDSNELIYL